jgi:hypothetical protein
MRLNTPSPSQSSRSSRSPRPPAGASTSGSSTSASVSNRSRSVEPATLSGSETEREPSATYSYSSDDQSITPPSSVSHAYSVLDGRLRRTSLPASPSKGRTASSIRSYSPNSTQRTPKKRNSTMSVPDPEASREYENNVTSAALATVASLRRSPGSSGKKNRQPLPREFREPRRASSDGRVSSTFYLTVRQRMTSALHSRPPRSRPPPKSRRGSGIAHFSAILHHRSHSCGAPSITNSPPHVLLKSADYPPHENIRLAGCLRICALRPLDLSLMITKMIHWAPAVTTGVDKQHAAGL